MKNAASPPVADDDSDCVSSSNFGACTAPDSNAPTGRSRRTILSGRMRRQAAAHGRDSQSFAIEFSRCEKSTIDAHGIESCVQLKTKNHAKTASLAVFTAVLLCTFH